MTEKIEKNKTNNEICPECGSKAVEIVEEDYKFTYGTGKEAVEITARVPVIKCKECDEIFLDATAEDICHEHICMHLGVMTPTEIKEVRIKYKLSQAEFADITKLGEATLSRWERGTLIQNKAYDNYLYLLQLPLNFQRLQQRGSSPQPKEQLERSPGDSFRVLKLTPELIRRKNAFELSCCLMAKES